MFLHGNNGYQSGYSLGTKPRQIEFDRLRVNLAEFIYFARPARATFPGDGTPEEFEVIQEHMAFLRQRLDAGHLVQVGRTQTEAPIGVCIFEANDLAAAKQFAADDPAVAKGIFKAEVQPYGVFLMRGRD